MPTVLREDFNTNDGGSAASAFAARAEMDADYAEALDPVSGEFLMSLVGVVDDPHAV